MKRKTATSPLETVDRAGGHNMEEEHIVDESESATSFTLSNIKRISMSKLVKETAFLCSVFDMNFKNVVEKHNHGV